MMMVMMIFFLKNNDFPNTFLAAQMWSITLGGSPEFFLSVPDIKKLKKYHLEFVNS